jgi:hypothetical protein
MIYLKGLERWKAFLEFIYFVLSPNFKETLPSTTLYFPAITDRPVNRGLLPFALKLVLGFMSRELPLERHITTSTQMSSNSEVFSDCTFG